jgi:hypothetical protein
VFGLELLKKGIISRIRNGKNTQIFRDQWLPRKAGLKVTGLKKNTRKRWVNQLIIEEDREWNVPLLYDLFQDHDVEAILDINIPKTDTKDCIAWNPEINGQFTVRSAYRLAVSLSQQCRGDESSSSAPNGCRRIWDSI